MVEPWFISWQFCLMRKIKKSERQKAIEKADKYCSLYVRLANADQDGYCTCYTCKKRKHRKEIQCWHRVWRRYIIVRRDLDNVRPQCFGCNDKRRWNWMSVEFKANLIDEIWIERVNAVDEKAMMEVRDPVNNNIDTPTILEIADMYKELIIPYKHLRE